MGNKTENTILLKFYLIGCKRRINEDNASIIYL